MKTFKLNLILLAVVAGSAIALQTSARTASITPGYYQVGPDGSPTGSVLDEDAPTANCLQNSEADCVAEYNANSERVSDITPGTFHN
jgi:hypothetical protein